MDKKKKLLFVPADVIRNEVSRSFYFARFLAEHYDLYFISRLDPQNAYFENKKVSKLYTLQCFMMNLLSSVRITKHPKWNYQVIKAPFLSHMVTHRILGLVTALKMSRSFNKMILERVVKRIEPDVIFYADGFDLYPALPGRLNISDMQDDFDKGNFRDNHYNTQYVKEQLQHTICNFVVSRKAAENLSVFYGASFTYMPNGVELDVMQKKNQAAIDSILKKHKLQNKFIVTYIGADAWYDVKLIREVFDLTKMADPDIHFLIVGNLPVLEADNATFAGPVSKDESYHYYWLSDAGILLKDSNGSNFLYNSIPLKIIQYGIANKWFVSPPIHWMEEENFGNVHMIKDYTARNITDKLVALKKAHQPEFDQAWLGYDWKELSGKIHAQINSSLKL